MPIPSDYRPLNPWGRSMPKPKRKATDAELYQVFVKKTKDGAIIPFGPAMIQECAEAFLVAINGQLALGKEKLISEPHLRKVAGPTKISEAERQKFLNSKEQETIIPLSSIL